MHIFIVYCHPSEDSFTSKVRDEFIRGLLESKNTFEISDLYKMKFQTDMTESEYFREANYRNDLAIENDVLLEQEKINNCDAIVFIYPIFWTEAPAKLVGWFDRVWTYGFAYGQKKMKKLSKALIFCIAGRTKEHLMQHNHIESMEKVMIGDRLFDRVIKSELFVLDGMSKANEELRQNNWESHLNFVFKQGEKINHDE